MAVKPITPAQVIGKRKNTIPDEVFEAFNEMIAENFRLSESSFKLKDVVSKIVSKVNHNRSLLGTRQVTREEVYDNGWADVEPIYRKEGWKVKFDSASRGDDYDDYFVFSQKK
jgi:hypothetical protein